MLTYHERLKKQPLLHFTYFTLLFTLFTLLFLFNTLVFSLQNLKVDDPSYLAVLKELTITYQQYRTKLLLTLAFMLLVILSIQQRFYRQSLAPDIPDSKKYWLIHRCAFDNVRFLLLTISFSFLTTLLFPFIYERFVVGIHSFTATHSDAITTIIEQEMSTASSSYLNLRFTTMPQIFQHLFLFSPENWSRLFFKSFLETAAHFALLFYFFNNLTVVLSTFSLKKNG